MAAAIIGFNTPRNSGNSPAVLINAAKFGVPEAPPLAAGAPPAGGTVGVPMPGAPPPRSVSRAC